MYFHGPVGNIRLSFTKRLNVSCLLFRVFCRRGLLYIVSITCMHTLTPCCAVVIEISSTIKKDITGVDGNVTEPVSACNYRCPDYQPSPELSVTRATSNVHFYVYMYVCNVSMYVRMYVHMYICMYVRMYVHTYIHTYYMYVRSTYVHACIRTYVDTYVRMHMCICLILYMYVCVC